MRGVAQGDRAVGCALGRTAGDSQLMWLRPDSETGYLEPLQAAGVMAIDVPVDQWTPFGKPSTARCPPRRFGDCVTHADVADGGFSLATARIDR